MRIEEVEYFYISEEILHHKGLTPKEKFMVAAYEQGIEFRNDAEACEHFSLGKEYYRRTMKSLIERGFIKENKVTPESIVNSLQNKTVEKLYTCEWCKEKVAVLQDHHYPIPRSKGGEEIVHICPNCHYTFHKLVGNKWCVE